MFLCAAIMIVATLLEILEDHLVGLSYIEALVLAILLGVAVRAAWRLEPPWVYGINFCAKFVLELAVVLLGASVSVTTIMALGPLLVVGIVAVASTAMALSYVICRALALPKRM